MASQAEKIVPFGKYKGQPVEALAQDRAYCEWLAGQDWFRTRYTTIHTLIVNNFTEPSETNWWKEHLQSHKAPSDLTLVISTSNLAFEQGGADVVFHAQAGVDSNEVPEAWGRELVELIDFSVECKPTMGDDYPAVLRQMLNQRQAYCYVNPDFRRVPLLGQGGYRGSGATFEQVKRIFGASNIKIVLLKEVEAHA
jgi:hypothetical protein